MSPGGYVTVHSGCERQIRPKTDSWPDHSGLQRPSLQRHALFYLDWTASGQGKAKVHHPWNLMSFYKNEGWPQNQADPYCHISRWGDEFNLSCQYSRNLQLMAYLYFNATSSALRLSLTQRSRATACHLCTSYCPISYPNRNYLSRYHLSLSG